jgi:hypothetical protein
MTYRKTRKADGEFLTAKNAKGAKGMTAEFETRNTEPGTRNLDLWTIHHSLALPPSLDELRRAGAATRHSKSTGETPVPRDMSGPDARSGPTTEGPGRRPGL